MYFNHKQLIWDTHLLFLFTLKLFFFVKPYPLFDILLPCGFTFITAASFRYLIPFRLCVVFQGKRQLDVEIKGQDTGFIFQIVGHKACKNESVLRLAFISSSINHHTGHILVKVSHKETFSWTITTVFTLKIC